MLTEEAFVVVEDEVVVVAEGWRGNCLVFEPFLDGDVGVVFEEGGPGWGRAYYFGFDGVSVGWRGSFGLADQFVEPLLDELVVGHVAFVK